MTALKEGELAKMYNKLTKMNAKPIMLKMLIDDLLLENSQLENILSEYQASLKAIKKINRNKNKDIDALCEFKEKSDE